MTEIHIEVTEVIGICTIERDLAQDLELRGRDVTTAESQVIDMTS